MHTFITHISERVSTFKTTNTHSLPSLTFVSSRIVVQLGEEAHLNTSFKHFIMFVQEFELIEKKELAPLQELIDVLLAKDAGHKKD
jgi:hypothetical protein